MKTDTKALVELHAVIGVCYEQERTFYVKRSSTMANYPDVWSLFSIQIDPAGFRPESLAMASEYFKKMSDLRLGGVDVAVLGHMRSGSCDKSLKGHHVTLHLYLVRMEEEPKLNPEYYIDGRWMTPEEYSQATATVTCGLCSRLWSDYAVARGYSDRSFAPELDQETQVVDGTGI